MRKFDSVEEVRQEMKERSSSGKPVKWLLYDKLVLDVTDFKHPGPAEFITDNIGEDIMQEFDDQGHS